MHTASILMLFALVAAGVVMTCGLAARRVLLLLFAFVGVPLGLTLDWNDLGTGPVLWILSGTAAAICMALTDTLQLRPPGSRDVREIAHDD
jgi:hypothetical protein